MLMASAWVQMQEIIVEPTGALSETMPESVDVALARAQTYLIRGQLQEAAHVLELSVAGAPCLYLTGALLATCGRALCMRTQLVPHNTRAAMRRPMH